MSMTRNERALLLAVADAVKLGHSAVEPLIAKIDPVVAAVKGKPKAKPSAKKRKR